MKCSYCRLKKLQFSLFIAIILFLPLRFVFGSEPSNIKSKRIFKDEEFYFSAQIPNIWETDIETDPNSNLRLSSKSPDGQQAIYIYAVKVKSKVDLEKLAKLDNNLFQDLGTLIHTNKVRKYLVYLKRIEKTYKADHLQTKLAFQSDGNVGYILMFRSLDENYLIFNEIVSTFRTYVPFSEKIKGIGGWVKHIIILILFFGFIYLLGKLGYLVRKGVETKKVLMKLKNEAQQKGWEVTKKWYALNRKSTLWIVGAILSWILLYAFIFFFLSLKNFLLSLFGLIPTVLGYFGVILVPKEDIGEDIGGDIIDYV